ncbi:MAG: polymer-forming cytoskeletal protein [Treponema sp.]|nr:polymer-forming cytoskeletal protein [Treponema sp.]
MFDIKDSDFFDIEDENFATIVEKDIVFTGNIRMRKPMMVRGNINGKIETESDVVIDSCAIVDAYINAARVLVRGKVNGDVYGENLVYVTASGSIKGDVTTKKVVLEPGSEFSGKCVMLKNEKK